MKISTSPSIVTEMRARGASPIPAEGSLEHYVPQRAKDQVDAEVQQMVKERFAPDNPIESIKAWYRSLTFGEMTEVSTQLRKLMPTGANGELLKDHEIAAWLYAWAVSPKQEE